MTDGQDAPRATENRSTTPASDTFRQYISSGWAERPASATSERPAAARAAERRARLSALYPGVRLVLPAGPAKQRSNDTDYPYRAHSAFAHLTGWGADTVPGSVLVLEPVAGGHEATLYFREGAGRDSDEFYANPEIGEFWTGPRPPLTDVAVDLGVATAGLDRVDAVFAALESDGTVETLIVREADRALTDRLDGARLLAASADAGVDVDTARDDELARDLSELRLVKDAFEIAEMRRAVAATQQGFDDVIADLGAIMAHPRGERLVEGTFNRRARAEGNTVGYDTIAASGPHACILHWTRNDGPVLPGDLILIDAGVELDSYYTADITRTLPVSGVFTAVQRRVYEAVREAADAAFAIVRPGIRFREVHAAAMQVIAQKTAEWGLLPVSAEESLAPDAGYHRRYMVHGTSHHLGLDVHDCGQARREFYMDGIVEAGMVFTIEPGLYFQPDDLTVPSEYRGIGVRIEDNILVTAEGAENLSAGIPRTADAVEEWMRGR
ncbi:aminopeptidase P family protein [Microcella sp.]|uniref:aminopeptidase P family protein n=1 Tax=Microcella sp. TaxID=1913979 RepID=UPI003F70C407